MKGESKAQRAYTEDEDWGIAIGRGGDRSVVGSDSSLVVKGGIKGQTPRIEDLIDVVEQSELPADQEERLRSFLDSLKSEGGQPTESSVETAQKSLLEINEALPQLREPLWQWISDESSVSMPIKIVARKILT